MPAVALRPGPTGRPRGPVLRLRSSSSKPMALAVVNGNLLIAWIEEEEFEGPVHAQFFDLSGHPLGSEMLLNEDSPSGDVRSVALAPLADSFVAAWQRFGRDWSFEAQRFSFTGEPLGAPLLQAQQSSGPFFQLGPRCQPLLPCPGPVCRHRFLSLGYPSSFVPDTPCCDRRID